jgi:hypothetical protein
MEKVSRKYFLSFSLILGLLCFSACKEILEPYQRNPELIVNIEKSEQKRWVKIYTTKPEKEDLFAPAAEVLYLYRSTFSIPTHYEKVWIRIYGVEYNHKSQRLRFFRTSEAIEIDLQDPQLLEVELDYPLEEAEPLIHLKQIAYNLGLFKRKNDYNSSAYHYDTASDDIFSGANTDPYVVLQDAGSEVVYSSEVPQYIDLRDDFFVRIELKNIWINMPLRSQHSFRLTIYDHDFGYSEDELLAETHLRPKDILKRISNMKDLGVLSIGGTSYFYEIY